MYNILHEYIPQPHSDSMPSHEHKDTILAQLEPN